MKKRFINIVSVLFAVQLITSCNGNDEGFKTEIPQVEASSELKEFMYAFLPDHVSYFSEEFPLTTPLDDNGRPRPLIINSQTELEKAFRTEGLDISQLPQIDFENYSLVVGMAFYLSEKRVPEKSLGQKLYKMGNEYMMELNFAYQTSYDVFSTTYLTYWGLYPKLDRLPIKDKINFIK